MGDPETVAHLERILTVALQLPGRDRALADRETGVCGRCAAGGSRSNPRDEATGSRRRGARRRAPASSRADENAVRGCVSLQKFQQKSDLTRADTRDRRREPRSAVADLLLRGPLHRSVGLGPRPRQLDAAPENGYVESLNGKLRDELLDRNIFYTLKEAQGLIEQWRQHYYRFRPHSALGYQPPATEAIEITPPGTASLPLAVVQGLT